MQIFGNVKIKRRQWERDRDRRLALDASPSHCARYGTQFEHTLDYNASTRTIFYYQIENVIFGCLRSLAAGVVYCERVSDVTSADFNVDEYINEFGEKIGNHRTACMSYPRCLCSMRALLTARKQIIIINKLYAFSDEWVLWHIPWSMSGLTKPKLHITSFHSWRKMKCIAGTPPDTKKFHQYLSYKCKMAHAFSHESHNYYTNFLYYYVNKKHIHLSKYHYCQSQAALKFTWRRQHQP